MEFEHIFVPFDRIDIEDTLFRISTGSVSAGLVESIKQTGLLNPPILIGCPKGYRIVSGFKRISACRKTGADGLVVRLLDPAAPIERCIQIAIVDNTSQRSLNLVEQAHAVALLSSVYTDRTQLAKAANSVGLSINPDMAGKLKRLAQMGALLKSGVLDGSIALPVAMQLHEMGDAPAVQAVGLLLRELGISLNRQREMLEWIISICRRDDMAPARLLAAGDIVDIRRNKDLDRRRKGQLIRDYLKKRRYPTIFRHEQRFAAIVHGLKLAHGTCLTASQHFESPTYSLNFEFKNQTELSAKLKEFEKIVKTDKLHALWDEFDD